MACPTVRVTASPGISHEPLTVPADDLMNKVAKASLGLTLNLKPPNP